MTTSASSSCIVFSANRRSWTDSLEIALWTPTTQKTGVFHWTSRTPKGRHAPGSVHPRTFLIFGFHRRKGFIQAFLSVENEVWVLRRNVCKLRFDWRGAGTCSGLWRWHTLAVSVCLYHCLVAVPWNTSPFTAARLYGCTTCSNKEFYVFQVKIRLLLLRMMKSVYLQTRSSWRTDDVVLVSTGMKKGIGIWCSFLWMSKCWKDYTGITLPKMKSTGPAKDEI